MTPPPCTSAFGVLSLQEDAALLRLVEVNGPNNWAEVSVNLPGRNAKSCRLRYLAGARIWLFGGRTQCFGACSLPPCRELCYGCLRTNTCFSPGTH